MRRTMKIAATAAALLAVALLWVVADTEASGDDKGRTMEQKTIQVYSAEEGRLVDVEKVELSQAEWRDRLTDQQFRVTREEGTERAFTGDLWDHKGEGVYRCVACGTDLFLSTTKFESGTGWPSFSKPLHPANIGTKEDRKLFTVRTEVHCARCGSHLGHVFEDGPPPTGLRYCLNSAALTFAPMDVDGDGDVER